MYFNNPHMVDTQMQQSFPFTGPFFVLSSLGTIETANALRAQLLETQIRCTSQGASGMAVS